MRIYGLELSVITRDGAGALFQSFGLRKRKDWKKAQAPPKTSEKAGASDFSLQMSAQGAISLAIASAMAAKFVISKPIAVAMKVQKRFSRAIALATEAKFVISIAIATAMAVRKRFSKLIALAMAAQKRFFKAIAVPLGLKKRLRRPSRTPTEAET